ncbi:MAG: Mur ligase family protein [Candidatus Micrarchaeota archaeon]|nr:Mur ligase family protein [Candidatus Micrarchaeota archaeon]
MAITYSRALGEIYSLDKFGSRLGLTRIRAILREIGSPQQEYKCVLVGGSNGKGSATEMIGAILQEEGAKVGTYFSPQIERFEERFRVDGKNAGKREIADAYALVRAAAGKVAQDATFFEVITTMALLIFAARKVKYAVLEVGLGGRLDATNAVSPEVSALTSLSLEHTDVLGDTIEKIAHEKCGIARKGRVLVCAKLGAKARRAVEKECRKIRAKIKIAGPLGRGFRLAAPGEFQRSNAAVAAGVCRELGVGERAIERGLGKCRPKYRLERRGNLLLDCCHNPEAAAALAKEVARIRVRGKKVLLFSAMRDKDYPSVLRTLAPLFDDIVITEVKLERGEKIAKLAKAAKEAGARHAKLEKAAARALARARRIAGKTGLAVVAGSIYLLSELFGKDSIKIRLAQ